MVVLRTVLYRERLPFLYNFLAFLLISVFFTFVAWGLKQMNAPASVGQEAISLDYKNLCNYALRTLLRMLIAVMVSLVFTFVYGTIAAKSKKGEQILIPLLDILQSLPILGYTSFTASSFLRLFPSTMWGAECVAIFAIFTSQAWNMTFSFYSSLKTIPQELEDVASIFRMTSWRKFWQISVPYALPALAWNIAISISSGWFFVVASEVITVGNIHVVLPGIGSYIALAIEKENLYAIGYALLAMALVIILYDQLLIRPLIVWSDKFRYEMIESRKVSRSWVLALFQKSFLIKKLFLPFFSLGKYILHFPLLNRYGVEISSSTPYSAFRPSWSDYIWYTSLCIIGCFSTYYIYHFLYNVGWNEVVHVLILGLITLLRVAILMIILALIWVPIGVYIGLNPQLVGFIQPVVQFLAAFPANLLFPIVFIFITRYNLNPNIWLSPLMVAGTQWYILFNVIAGIASLPNDLKDVVKILGIKGWNWWFKVVLPVVMPHLVIGIIAAVGGAWNTSIVAEFISFGEHTIVAQGIGSYITQMTLQPDFNKLVLGMGIMALLVVLCNRLIWQPLHNYCMRRFKV